MNKIDDILLDRIYQPVTDFLYNLTSKDCFWQSSIACYLAALSLSLQLAVMGAFVMAIFVGGFLVILAHLHAHRTVNVRSLVKPGLSNPVRVIWYSIRVMCSIFFITMLPMEVMAMRPFSVLFWILNLSAEYAIACTPKPRKPIRFHLPTMVDSVSLADARQ